MLHMSNLSHIIEVRRQTMGILAPQYGREAAQRSPTTANGAVACLPESYIRSR
jgi:hypothetical protein